MDLVWRTVVDFLLYGRSMTVFATVDESRRRICFHDPNTPMESLALKRWRKLERGLHPEQKLQLDQAIEDRDALTIRRLALGALHIACTRLRIESQEVDAPRSVHVVWFSSIYTANPTVCCTYGPKAAYTAGCTISVTVAPPIAEFLERSFYTHPSISRDDKLFSTEGRQLHSALHATLTPMKRSDLESLESTVTPGQASPLFSDHSDADNSMQCEVCYDTFPAQLMLFSESCSHTTCLCCVAACAEKHLANPTATLSNMLCPSPDCEECIAATELRAVVSVDDAAYLELNEVRLALRDDCATCPKCTCSFERVQQSDESDPLKNRFKCPVCETTFCNTCGVHPFHEGEICKPSTSGPHCRYCGSEAVSIEPLVCEAVECRRKGENSCTVSKHCGHLCHGKKGERQCTTCLEEACQDCHPQQTSGDYCVICYCETLGEAPCIELDCGHVFHYHCVVGKLQRRWPTVRITFTFLQCPLCTKQIAHHLLLPILAPILKIKQSLEARYIERLKLEKLLNSDSILSHNSPYYNQPLRYAEEYLTYYLCSKCNKPYFGGLKQCADVEGEDIGRDDLICGGCSAGSAVCTKHGGQYMEYKCRYCCNLAVWYCWGTTHFCDQCHSPPRKTVREECPGEEKCPLGGRHRPNGEEFAVGCAICRSESLRKPEQDAAVQ